MASRLDERKRSYKERILDYTWPQCGMCGHRYDPEFMSSLRCRDLTPTDEILPGCPASRELNGMLRRRGRS